MLHAQNQSFMQQLHFASVLSPVSTLADNSTCCRAVHRGQCQDGRSQPGLCDGLHLNDSCQMGLGPRSTRYYSLLMKFVHSVFTAWCNGYGSAVSCNSSIMPDSGSLLVELCASDNASNVRLKELLQHRFVCSMFSLVTSCSAGKTSSQCRQ